jgi:hypothetical protein
VRLGRSCVGVSARRWVGVSRSWRLSRTVTCSVALVSAGCTVLPMSVNPIMPMSAQWSFTDQGRGRRRARRIRMVVLTGGRTAAWTRIAAATDPWPALTNAQICTAGLGHSRPMNGQVARRKETAEIFMIMPPRSRRCRRRPEGSRTPLGSRNPWCCRSSMQLSLTVANFGLSLAVDHGGWTIC